MLSSTLLLLCSLLAAERSAPNPYLAHAKKAYQAIDLKLCLARVDQAEHCASSDVERVEIEIYGGLCLYELGRVSEARERFEMALSLNPAVSMPPYTSPRVTALLESLRQRHARALQTGAPSALAPRPTTEAPTMPLTPQPASLLAAGPVRTAAPPALPHRTRWWLVGGLAGASAAGLAAGLLFGLQAQRLTDVSNRAPFESDSVRVAADARARARVANWSYAGAGVLAAAGITLAIPF